MLYAAHSTRQKYSEFSTRPWPTFYLNITTTLSNDAVDHRKSQPCSFSYRFGSKEWLENPRFGNLVHPVASITNIQLDVLLKTGLIRGRAQILPANIVR